MIYLLRKQCVNVVYAERDTSYGLVVNKNHKFYHQVTFIFIKTMSHDLLVQVAYWRASKTRFLGMILLKTATDCSK